MNDKKTILVTGSSRGIGREIARLAYKRGYKVIIHGKTATDNLLSLHKELKGSVKVFFDVANKRATQNTLAKLIRSIGPIDVLVNNAGIAKNFIKDISTVDDDLALEEYKTNVLGSIHCIQAVLPAMLDQRRGSVINISSTKGYTQLATISTFTYAPTKSAVISITMSLAKKYSPLGVRFNVVAPGYVETDQVNDWNQETFNRINQGTLLGRMAKPAEIAPVVLFLASEESSYMTGSEILVDGGYMLGGK